MVDLRRPVDTIYDSRLGDAPARLEVTMLVRLDGQVVARSSAVDETGRFRLPPRWLERTREERDAELDWWFEEVATVWLEGCWEQWPSPEPKQEALL